MMDRRSHKLHLLLLPALLALSGCGVGLCISETNCAGSGGLSLTTSSLTLRAVEIDDSEFTVAWPAASGGTAPYTYSLYYSTSANLDSIANIKANGTLAGTIVDDTSFQITALPIDKDYFFNVIVSDASGNELAYDMRSPFCGGAGVSGDEYQICDAGSLQYVQFHLSRAFVVTQDIDLSGTRDWNSGVGFKSISLFEGTLDGQDFALDGLSITLFQEMIGSSSAIEHLTLSNVSLTGDGAPLVNDLQQGRISDCHSSGAIVAGSGQAGGLLNRVFEGAIVEDSSSSVTVSGGNYVGGLIGRFGLSGTATSTLRRSFATGNVIGDTRVGGLVGRTEESTVLDCYATGNVHSSGSLVGGLIGQQMSTSSLSRSYSIGNVFAASGSVGGLTGTSSGGISNSFAIGNVTAGSGNLGSVSSTAPTGPVFWFNHPFNPANCYQGGNTGCTAQTNPTWFYTKTNYDAAGLNWDFTSSGAWIMPATGKYPVLRWQNPNRSIQFPPEFRNGRKIGFSDMAAYRVWGFCGTPGETVSFGGPNAPGNTTCNGGTFTTNWDFSGQSDGSIDITVQQGTATPVTRRLVKDTASCVAGGLNDETAGAAIDARFAAAVPPVVVCNVDQMNRIQTTAAHHSRDFILGANINMTAYNGNPIASSGAPFSGTLDGDGFFLDQMTITGGADYRALFASTAIGAFFAGAEGNYSFIDLGLERVSVSGNSRVGALAGRNFGANGGAKNVYVTGFVSGTGGTGGLVGELWNEVSDSFSTADVISSSGAAGGFGGAGISESFYRSFATGHIRGNGSVGGLIGSGGNIDECYFSGTVTGAQNSVGGLTGDTAVTDSIVNSYSTGSVYGGDHVGGLVGDLSGGTVSNSYSTAAVFGTLNNGGPFGDPVGGLAGLVNWTETLSHSFALGSVSGVGAANGAIVGTAFYGSSITNLYRSTAATSLPCVGWVMDAAAVGCSNVSSSVFLANSSGPLSTWDFSTVWKFPTTGGLPILQWQEEE